MLKRPWRDVPTPEEVPQKAAAQEFKALHIEQLTSMEAKAAEEAAAAEAGGEEDAEDAEKP